MKEFIVTCCLFGIVVLILLVIGRLFQVYQNIIPMGTGVLKMSIYLLIIFILVGIIIWLMHDDDNDDLGSVL